MSTLNVLRYTALGLGIVFGLKNDWALQGAAKENAESKKLARQLALVNEAKKEYARLSSSKDVEQKTSSSSVKVDFEDPNLDFGAAILSAVDSLKH
ncbi:F1F0 ATP synthase subunit e Ecym_8171 [Eremothecium cymbalariae DBVPG|uniref:ATP synthase F(0) complex subunit e, mitochondrial n=1 Tax=Eremothecium cymbalariae (strain CBS 270.75 / DBVPG 7215 / KCTC 17166 / NRRL Y-17582) TaxID=931890 RepID=G8JX83_ERECY|nr:Hypothetical protein Ecym_8171 [Eremothecium cymbalariae DBVPG\